MPRIFAIANQKGGVGKTTTSVNLAAALGQAGQRTLLVDLDPQGNATMGSGIDKRTLKSSVYQVLVGLASLADARVTSPHAGLDVLPANRDLAGAEVELVELEASRKSFENGDFGVRRRLRFRPDRLSAQPEPADAERALRAHGVIIPMQCEYYALEGLSDLVNTIKKVHANLNTAAEGDRPAARHVRSAHARCRSRCPTQLTQHFGDKVFKTVIPRNVRLAEAPSYGVPGVVFDAQSKGAQRLCRVRICELLERIRSLPDA
jgi:chromosome partitioning protein